MKSKLLMRNEKVCSKMILSSMEMSRVNHQDGSQSTSTIQKEQAKALIQIPILKNFTMVASFKLVLMMNGMETHILSAKTVRVMKLSSAKVFQSFMTNTGTKRKTGNTKDWVFSQAMMARLSKMAPLKVLTRKDPAFPYWLRIAQPKAKSYGRKTKEKKPASLSKIRRELVSIFMVREESLLK